MSGMEPGRTSQCAEMTNIALGSVLRRCGNCWSQLVRLLCDGWFSSGKGPPPWATNTAGCLIAVCAAHIYAGRVLLLQLLLRNPSRI